MASPLVQGITEALGPGISQRAAAARTQTVWRWLVLKRMATGLAGARFRIILKNKKSYKHQAPSPKHQATSGCDILSRVIIFLDTNCDTLTIDFCNDILYNIGVIYDRKRETIWVTE